MRTDHRSLVIQSALSIPPATARTDDGNHWETGRCWLWCGKTRTRVTWIGPVTVAGHSVPMYACEGCMRALGDQALETVISGDLEHTYAPAEQARGRHRRLL